MNKENNQNLMISDWHSIFKNDHLEIQNNNFSNDSLIETISDISKDLHQTGIYTNNLSNPTTADWAQVISGFISVALAASALYLTIKESRSRRIEKRRIELRSERELKDKIRIEKLSIEMQNQSVKPLLSLEVDHNIKTGVFEAWLVNNGLGPAIIQNFSIKLDNIEIDSYSPLTDTINHLLESIDKDFYIKCYFGATGTAISANDKKLLFKIEYVDKTDAASEEMQKIFRFILKQLERIQYFISYKSLYGQTFNNGFIT